MIQVKWDLEGGDIDEAAAEAAVKSVLNYYKQALAGVSCPDHGGMPLLAVRGRRLSERPPPRKSPANAEAASWVSARGFTPAGADRCRPRGYCTVASQFPSSVTTPLGGPKSILQRAVPDIDVPLTVPVK